MLLTRIQHQNAIVTYQSPQLNRLGVIHGFSTRLGGASRGPYASLNLATLEKSANADCNTVVAENFRRLRRALNCPRHLRVHVSQVHSSQVHLAGPDPIKPAETPCADAIITDHPHHLLTIRTADCVPLLVASPDGRVVAAIHAGWRGIIAGIIANTIDRLVAHFAVTRSTLLAAVGPAISADYFEVGPEVAQAFTDHHLGAVVRRPPDQARPHLDLPAAAVHRLLAAGLSETRIDTTDRCTCRDADEFFSHRRDHAVTGRMAAVIAPKE